LILVIRNINAIVLTDFGVHQMIAHIAAVVRRTTGNRAAFPPEKTNKARWKFLSDLSSAH
jgi:hypothetical protein